MTSFKVLAQPLRDVDMGQRGCKVGVGVWGRFTDTCTVMAYTGSGAEIVPKPVFDSMLLHVPAVALG